MTNIFRKRNDERKKDADIVFDDTLVAHTELTEHTKHTNHIINNIKQHNKVCINYDNELFILDDELQHIKNMKNDAERVLYVMNRYAEFKNLVHVPILVIGQDTISKNLRFNDKNGERVSKAIRKLISSGLIYRALRGSSFSKKESTYVFFNTAKEGQDKLEMYLKNKYLNAKNVGNEKEMLEYFYNRIQQLGRIGFRRDQ